MGKATGGLVQHRIAKMRGEVIIEIFVKFIRKNHFLFTKCVF